MSSPSKTVMCDACNRRIQREEHELHLSDALTGQLVGIYHAPRCQHAAAKYWGRGVVLVATYVHPDRCGDDQEHCDGGMSEMSVA